MTRDYSKAVHCEKQYLAAYLRGDRQTMLYWARREYHALRIAELDAELASKQGPSLSMR